MFFNDLEHRMIKKRLSILVAYLMVFIGFADLGFASMSIMGDPPSADTENDTYSTTTPSAESKYWRIDRRGDYGVTTLYNPFTVVDLYIARVNMVESSTHGQSALFTFRMHPHSPVVIISVSIDLGEGDPGLENITNIAAKKFCHSGVSNMWLYFPVYDRGPGMNYRIRSFGHEERCSPNFRYFKRDFLLDIADFSQSLQGGDELATSPRLANIWGTAPVIKDDTTFMSVVFEVAHSEPNPYNKREFFFDATLNNQDSIDKLVQIFDEARKIYNGQLHVELRK